MRRRLSTLARGSSCHDVLHKLAPLCMKPCSKSTRTVHLSKRNGVQRRRLNLSCMQQDLNVADAPCASCTTGSQGASCSICAKQAGSGSLCQHAHEASPLADSPPRSFLGKARVVRGLGFHV